MNYRAVITAVLGLIAVIIYLFVEAPAPLPDNTLHGTPLPTATALTLVQAENATVRALYTQEIVGAGQKVGLAFRTKVDTLARKPAIGAQWPRDGV